MRVDFPGELVADNIAHLQKAAERASDFGHPLVDPQPHYDHFLVSVYFFLSCFGFFFSFFAFFPLAIVVKI